MSYGIFATGSVSTATGTVCTIQCGLPTTGGRSISNPTLTNQLTGTLITSASYYILAGTGVSAGTVTFYALGADGVWRALASPAAVSPVFATTPDYNGVISGVFHGLQMQVTGLTGGNLTYCEITAMASSSF